MSPEMFVAIICAFGWLSFVALFFVQQYSHALALRQRDKFNGDLLNRLMAKDWGEYRMIQAGPLRDVPPLSDEQEARLAEQWASEIKAQEQVLGEERNQGIDLGFN